jgi:hypothetical protein
MKTYTYILFLIIALVYLVGCKNEKKDMVSGSDVKGDSIYYNSLFEYRLVYPSQLIPQGESMNEDGQKFVSDAGVILSAWASYNALSNSVKGEFDFTKENFKEYDWKISVEEIKENTFYLSGYEPNGSIFYQKTIYNKEKDAFYSVLLEYPETERIFGDKIIKNYIKRFPN